MAATSLFSALGGQETEWAAGMMEPVPATYEDARTMH